MLPTYAFTGRKGTILAALSISFGLVSVIVCVISKQLTPLSRRPRIHQGVSPLFNGIAVSLLFVLVKHTGCFAISDQPTFSVLPGAGAVQEISTVRVLFAYHLAVRL
ncbi:hypothetical protein EDB92DRAFT_1191072 [Lactarius akahatsu]|uniref:Uncharacterized protein n=1 Tax=Lactarius akahatsu TaxID=416441 RepID=A0AAD4LTL4_9AGAM|nr:hypothetical protein EDB92DRAFT_1191072 [Lactarius akahatsu]